nr:hypothetical protein [Tanacetum cinerariifolium]
MTSITSLCKMACQIFQRNLEEKQLKEERVAKAQNWKLPVCYDDEERFDSLDDNIISELPPSSAITPDEPVLSTEEPDNSLSMGDEHLDTIPATESNDFLKSGVKDLIPIPSESEDIRLIEKLLYDNSSPRLLEEFVSANSDAASEYFSPSPILIKDSDSLMEEIDLFCTLDYPMPPGIEDKDYDSKRDILIPKDLPSNNSLSFAEKESFHVDIPPFSRPPAKPSD